MIPLSLKGSKDVVKVGPYAIFEIDLITGGKVANRLVKRDVRGSLPDAGKVMYRGKNYWWCRWGFLTEDWIYNTK